jgi:hypothetical protein
MSVSSKKTNTILDGTLDTLNENHYINKDKKTHLNLLKNQEVIDWIIKKGRWLELKQDKKNKKDKKIEKEWRNSIISTNNNKWTKKLGQIILKEILLVLKGKVWKPKKSINGYKPDWETKDGIYKVKTRNWTTSKTSGEKILGIPYLYSDIPALYGKPLYIILIAYNEYDLSTNFELFNTVCPIKTKMIEQWKEMDIEFIKCSDLLKEIKLF